VGVLLSPPQQLDSSLIARHSSLDFLQKSIQGDVCSLSQPHARGNKREFCFQRARPLGDLSPSYKTAPDQSGFCCQNRRKPVLLCSLRI
jgi:hypothetical protein